MSTQNIHILVLKYKNKKIKKKSFCFFQQDEGLKNLNENSLIK